MTQEDVIAEVYKLSLQPQDVLVLRTTSEVNPHAVLHMVERLQQRGLDNLVFVIGDDSDICLFGEEQMARWGWVRTGEDPPPECRPFRASHPDSDIEHLGAGT
ncbi:MAG: hypothetical protein ACE5Q6_07925 [Dehalococcoidia bacterium]